MKKILLALAIVVIMASMAFAANPTVLSSGGGINTFQYHSYDGLLCTDCHTLHNSEDGAAISVAGGAFYGTGPNRELLKRGDWTDMCLSCHKQGQNTSATAALPGVENSGWVAPIVMTVDGVDPSNIAMPAGDFYYSNADPKKGHNPAYTKGSMSTPTSFFMASDTVLGSTPPGGTITDGEWSCHSCHGMHSRFSGSYTAWRQIKRKVNNIVTTGNETPSFGVETSGGGAGATAAGYEPIKSNSRGDIVGTSYLNVRPDTNPLEGADLFADESDTNKNVYRGGFSSFCSACHGDFHGTLTTEGGTDNTQTAGVWMKHPTNLEMGPVSGSRKYGLTTYNAVITNVKGTNPNPSGYDWKYPLVQPDSNFDVTSSVTGGTLHNSDRIMCLTCHKAHASKFENSTRWDTNQHSFIADGATDAWGEISDGDNPAYGCGKCHQKGGTKAFVKGF